MRDEIEKSVRKNMARAVSRQVDKDFREWTRRGADGLCALCDRKAQKKDEVEGLGPIRLCVKCRGGA